MGLKNGENREIAVENANFSTMSTGLSTGFFFKITGIFIQNGLHKKFRQHPTKSPLFRPREFASGHKLVTKLLLDKFFGWGKRWQVRTFCAKKVGFL
jgi:hypothetical protein